MTSQRNFQKSLFLQKFYVMVPMQLSKLSLLWLRLRKDCNIEQFFVGGRVWETGGNRFLHK